MGTFLQLQLEKTRPYFAGIEKRARQALPVVALFLLTVVFFSDILRSNGLFIERDLGQYFIPPRHFWVASLKAGDFPLWNPLNFGGHPFFATLQPGILYPPNILFFFLPFNDAFNWIIVSHFFLAGAFTYALLRFLEAGRGASFLGAVIFLLGGYLLSLQSLLSALLSIVWLPLILLLFCRALRFNSFWSAAGAGAVLTISFLGGGAETVLGTCLALGLMTVFARSFGGTPAFALKALLVMGAVFSGLAAIQLLPFLELSGQSIRKSGLSYQEAITWSASPVDFISYLIQDPYNSLTDLNKYWIRQSWLKTLYVGGLPFLLAIIYIMKDRKGRYFWLILSALSVFLALGGYNLFYPYLYKFIPGVNKIRYPVKFLFLGTFSLCIMAGLGLQRLLNAVRQEEGKRFQWLTIILATMTAVIFFLLYIKNDTVLAFLKTAGFDAPVYNAAAVNLYNLKRMIFYFIIAAFALWIIVKTKGSRYAVGALCLVMIFDLFGNFGYYAWTKPELYFADNWTVQQVKAGIGDFRKFTTHVTSAPTSTVEAPNITGPAIGHRILASSFNLNYGIRDMWGAEVMRLSRTDDLYNALRLSPSVDATRILDFFSTKYVISTKPISSPYFTLVGADLEGLQGDRKKLLKEPTIKLYRNKRVLPRTFLVPAYQVAADPAAALALVSRRDFIPEKTVVLEEKPIWDQNISSTMLAEGPADSRILHETNNTIDVQARVAQPSLLYLSDTYCTGWNAYVDGNRTKIYRANYNFRAVPLPPGDHRVAFRYEPMSFYAGAGITGVTLVILIAWGIKSLMMRRRTSCLSAIESTTVTA